MRSSDMQMKETLLERRMMAMHETFNSYISFYLKPSRIHIFMDVLRGIGSPSRICIKIDHERERLLLMPYYKVDYKSHAVPKDVYRGNVCMELCSLKLCKIIANRHKLDSERSYRMPGIVDVDDKIAVFDLTRATEIRRDTQSAR